MATPVFYCVLSLLLVILAVSEFPAAFLVVGIPYEDQAADFMTEQNKSELTTTQEKHEYQAEVSRLMDIIINYLYSDKGVCLRELISNAADAMWKVRLLRLSAPESTSDIKLEIRIDYDKNAKTISIADTGIGMTKQDLINNLGTIAKSGTTNFLESLEQGGDANLIGQFGVGFYSTFLVADKVTVTSKHDDDDQYIWESSADGSFTVAKDPRNNTLVRGTRITLHLKDDSTDFLNEMKLKNLASNYGKFISFPIFVKVEKTVTEEITVEEEEKENGNDYVEVKEQENKRKTKKVEKKVYEWELVNPDKAIWLRPKEEVDEQQYKDFYKSISKDYADPLSYTHFTVEGEIEFKAILYIPSRAPMDMFENYFNTHTSIKLYVRRAFVGDNFDSLLPKYLHFIKGVVSSDDLPLNVSREQLQQHYLVSVISKKLVKKTLELIRKMSKDSEAQKQDFLKKSLEETNEEKKKELNKAANEPTTFDKFWKEFSRFLKLGCYEDDENRSKIAKVMRFYTSNSGDKQISFNKYLENAGELRKVIYYISGESVEQLMKSPHMQIFLKKSIEVIFLIEAMDEPCIQKLTDFEGKKFVSIAKGDAQIEETDDEKERQNKLKKMYDPLLKMLEQELMTKVQKVELSRRLVVDPCAVVSSQWGYSAQMEKLMKSQTFADPSQARMMANQKVFEINPKHPVIIDLLSKIKADKYDVTAKQITNNLFQAAMLASGFDVESPTELANMVYQALSIKLGVDPNAELKDIDVTEVEEEGDDKSTADEVADDEAADEVADDEAADEVADDEAADDGAADDGAADDEAADGEAADGEAADGEAADGEAADGEAADGEAADGEAADGEAADGEAADGEAADGEAADGEAADVEAADDEAIDDEVADDERNEDINADHLPKDAELDFEERNDKEEEGSAKEGEKEKYEKRNQDKKEETETEKTKLDNDKDIETNEQDSDKTEKIDEKAKQEGEFDKQQDKDEL